MSKIYTSADQLIGKTPLLEVKRIESALDLKARILVKLEYFNPAGSHTAARSWRRARKTRSSPTSRI